MKFSGALALSGGLAWAVMASAGCREARKDEGKASSPPARETVTYLVKGVIKDLRPETGKVIIEHEEVPGYMEAMTMPLRVQDPAEMANLKRGDRVSFHLNVTEKADWIDKIEVLGADNPPPPRENESDLPDLRPISPGQQIPDATLVDVDGNRLELKAFRGNALAITFIYTRCPLPTFCPRLNAHFAETQAILANDPDGPRNWKLLSITIDPQRDTPERLASYSQGLGADPRHWTFATGSLRDITEFTLKCGLRFWDERGLIQHNLRTLIVDADGTVLRILEESEWKPEDLAADLRGAALGKK